MGGAGVGEVGGGGVDWGTINAKLSLSQTKRLKACPCQSAPCVTGSNAPPTRRASAETGSDD